MTLPNPPHNKGDGNMMPSLPIDASEETRNRTMMRHGSGMLLRAISGEPEPIPEPIMPRFVMPARSPNHPVPPGMIARQIIQDVAAAFDMEPSDLTGRSRKTPHMLARFVAVRLLRDRTWADGSPRFTTSRIGGFFDRDHSTISHALDTFGDKMGRFPQAREIYEAMRG